MAGRSEGPGGARRSVVVFSDLDGTLLDHETYSFDAARPALDHIDRAGIPLVLCTSKTRAEIEPIRASLHNRHPFISENGGAVFIPVGYFSFDIDGALACGEYLTIEIGDPYADLTSALARASHSSGVPVRGFSAMTVAEVVSATGLPAESAQRAREREYDEPFEILDPSRASRLLAAIEREGKRWTAGGRFHHIMGGNDKSVAVRFLTQLYRQALGPVVTVGLGDAPNDAGFLNEVDVPIIVGSPRSAELRALVPHGRCAASRGPAGWSEELLAVLDELG